MAEKGAKERLYDVAFHMFAEGKSLTDIEAALGVSRQTLSQWKADTKRPGDELDDWDKARAQKQTMCLRLKNLLERELGFAEEAPAGKITPAALDGISKLGALVQRFEQSEREGAMKSAEYRAALFLDFLKDLIEYGSRNDAGIVAVIEDNFDDIVTWGRVKYQGK